MSASKLTDAEKREMRAFADATRGVGFWDTPGEVGTYPTRNVETGDFVDEPIVVVGMVGGKQIARMRNGDITLLPKRFPFERVTPHKWFQMRAAAKGGV